MPAHPFTEFIIFILVVLWQRIFHRFLLLCIAVFLVQLFIPEFSLPLVYYFGILFVGFVWSAFLVDRDLSQAYQKLTSLVSTEKTPKSELSISFAHGNEYTYSISDPYDGKNNHITRMQNAKRVKCHFDERGVFFINGEVYYSMATASLDINLHIHNSGKLPLDVFSINLDNDLTLNHLRFFDNGTFHHGSKLQIPFHVESEELITLQVKYKISISKGSNAALFAADFQALPRSILHEILVGTMDVNGKKQPYVSQINIPSKPLIDLYANQWREYDQEEYLVLSGSS